MVHYHRATMFATTELLCVLPQSYYVLYHRAAVHYHRATVCYHRATVHYHRAMSHYYRAPVCYHWPRVCLHRARVRYHRATVCYHRATVRYHRAMMHYNKATVCAITELQCTTTELPCALPQSTVPPFKSKRLPVNNNSVVVLLWSNSVKLASNDHPVRYTMYQGLKYMVFYYNKKYC